MVYFEKVLKALFLNLLLFFCFVCLYLKGVFYLLYPWGTTSKEENLGLPLQFYVDILRRKRCEIKPDFDMVGRKFELPNSEAINR